MKKAIKEVNKKIALGKCPIESIASASKKFHVSFKDLKFAISNKLKK